MLSLPGLMPGLFPSPSQQREAEQAPSAARSLGAGTDQTLQPPWDHSEALMWQQFNSSHVASVSSAVPCCAGSKTGGCELVVLSAKHLVESCQARHTAKPRLW